MNIDEKLDLIIAKLATIERNQARAMPPEDVDLSDPWADETIRFDPHNWNGESYKGQKMSACPSDYLQEVASAYRYFATKNEASNAMTDKGKPKAEFDRRSAARALAWSKRAKPSQAKPAGAAAHRAVQAAPVDFDDSADIPF